MAGYDPLGWEDPEVLATANVARGITSEPAQMAFSQQHRSAAKASHLHRQHRHARCLLPSIAIARPCWKRWGLAFSRSWKQLIQMSWSAMRTPIWCSNRRNMMKGKHHSVNVCVWILQSVKEAQEHAWFWSTQLEQSRPVGSEWSALRSWFGLVSLPGFVRCCRLVYICFKQ